MIKAAKATNLQVTSAEGFSVSRPLLHGDYAFNDKEPAPEIHLALRVSRTSCTHHARRPLFPSSPSIIPAAIKPENAPDKSDPEYKRAVLKPSSFLVYHDDK